MSANSFLLAFSINASVIACGADDLRQAWRRRHKALAPRQSGGIPTTSVAGKG